MAYLQIGRWLLLSWAVPLLGGAVGYWKTKTQDKRLAHVLIIGTFSIPVLVTGAVLGYQITPVASIVGAALAGIVVPLLVTRYIIAENPYRNLLWAAYCCIPGALYLYLGPYREQPRLRRAVKTFVIGSVVVTVLLLLLSPTIPLIGVSLFGFA